MSDKYICTPFKLLIKKSIFRIAKSDTKPNTINIIKVDTRKYSSIVKIDVDNKHVIEF